MKVYYFTRKLNIINGEKFWFLLIMFHFILQYKFQVHFLLMIFVQPQPLDSVLREVKYISLVLIYLDPFSLTSLIWLAWDVSIFYLTWMFCLTVLLIWTWHCHHESRLVNKSCPVWFRKSVLKDICFTIQPCIVFSSMT